MNSIEIDRESVSPGMVVVNHNDLVSRVVSLLDSPSVNLFLIFCWRVGGTFFFLVEININGFVCEFSVININYIVVVFCFE